LADPAPSTPAEAGQLPITITLPTASYVTVVIEDQNGNRVRNLLASHYLPAGQNTVYWDGYDDGTIGPDGTIVRQRVPPGVYNVRGLTRDGIHLHYEFSVNSPGNPPWPTKDGSGAWLGDHTPPAAIVYLPQGVTSPNGKGTAHFIVSCTAAESGSEFVWLAQDGSRLYGMNDGFWGATELAVDPGPNADSDYYAYAFESGERDSDNNKLDVRGFKSDGTFGTVFQTTFPMDLKQSILLPFKTTPPYDEYSYDGLAVYNGYAVIAFTRMNELIVGNVRTGQLVATLPIDSPRGLAFDPQGRLYVVSGLQVKRFNFAADGTQISDETTLVSSGLQYPTRITVDTSVPTNSPAADAAHQPMIYVSDVNKVSQVKVYAADGTFIRAIGEPGGPQLGFYDEKRMSNPQGTCIDGSGNLWVAEDESLPKRLSEWTKEGTFIRAFYGPPQYGGGGMIDPVNKNRFYYADASGGGIEFALDWKTGTSKPYSIYYRRDLPVDEETMPNVAPERAIYVGGFQYMVNCYNAGLRYNPDRGTGIWRMDKDGIARPIAAFSTPGDLNSNVWGFAMKNRDDINKLFPSTNTTQILFAWCDKNDDHIAETDEIQTMPAPVSTGPGHENADLGIMPLVQSDLSLTLPYGTRIAPPTITAKGDLLYDLTKVSRIGNTEAYRSPIVAGGESVSLVDGSNNIGKFVGARLDGTHHWYMNALLEQQQPLEGYPLSPTRLIGLAVTPREGDGGPMIAINGEMGSVFLVTMDGLFIQDLGGDAKTTPYWRYPVATRGMQIDPVSFEQEHFHPSIDQTSDGNIYLVAGFQHSSILSVDGLSSIHRVQFGQVTVTPEFQAGAAPTELPSVGRPARGGRKELTVAQTSTAPQVDGNVSEWPASAQWVVLDGRASASILTSNGNLYAAYKTGDTDALDNAGGDFHDLFKFGGALDLMIGSDPNADLNRRGPAPGDERLLVTQVNGKTKAVLYIQTVMGAFNGSPYEFESPIGQVNFDEVKDVSDQVTLASDGTGDYEFSVPLSVLNLNVSAGEQILGDIGLLRGNGGKTSQRLYWNNQRAFTVSDLPSEARLDPGAWGIWHF